MKVLVRSIASVMTGTLLALGILGAHATLLPIVAHAQIIEESAGNGSTIPLPTSIGDLVQIALALLGVVAIVFIILGSITYATAGGNDDQQVEGRRVISSGVIGLAVILSAFAITQFVIQSLAQASQ